MARRYGRAPRGERLRAAIPHGHWKTTTFVAGLRLQGIVAPLVFDGPINAQVFEAYVDQFLVPTLRSGDVVIMDNLSSHKGAKVRERIEAAGARLLYLPPYSPDFNQSRRCSRNSRPCSAKPRNAPSRAFGTPSLTVSRSSLHQNAQTTSRPQVTTQPERKTLSRPRSR
jgi:transposase